MVRNMEDKDVSLPVIRMSREVIWLMVKLIKSLKHLLFLENYIIMSYINLENDFISTSSAIQQLI